MLSRLGGLEEGPRYIQNKHFCTHSICSTYTEEHIFRGQQKPFQTQEHLWENPFQGLDYKAFWNTQENLWKTFQGLNLQDLTSPSLRVQWACNCINLRELLLLLGQEYGTGTDFFCTAADQIFFNKRNGGWFFVCFLAGAVCNRSKYSKLIENCPREEV